MAGRKQTTPEQEAAIRIGASEGRSAKQIWDKLEADGLRSGLHPDITVRLVQMRVRAIEPRDSSGTWSVADAKPEEARLVLDVAAYVADATAGRLWLTRELAGWVARVREAAPDVPAAWAYALARAYRVLDKEATPQDARAIDIVLAARPWESPERAYWYQALIYRTEQAFGHQPQGLEIDIRALLERRPGGAVGSFGNPWTPHMSEDQFKESLLNHQQEKREAQQRAWRSRRPVPKHAGA